MSDQEIIDGYLGDDRYDWWQELQRRLRREKKRYENTIKKFTGVYDDGLWVHIELAERLDFDYSNAMNLIAQGKKIVKEDVKEIEDLLELTLDIIEKENDLFEAIFLGGFAAMWVAFPFHLFKAKAGFAKQKIEALIQLLKKAKHEMKEAWIQKGLDVGLTVFTTVAPELGLIEKFVVMSGKLTYDHFLGPKQPGIKKVGKSAFTTYSGAISKVKAVGETDGFIIKNGGKAIKYYGVVFDWSEILQGYSNVNAIEAAMKETQKAYDSLIKLIDSYSMQLRMFQISYERVERNLKESYESILELRDALSDEKTDAKYIGSTPKAWRILP